MATIAGIRDGLRTRLETISGLRVHDTVPGQINPPAAIVRRRRTDYDSTMARGSDDYEFVVTVFVQLASDPKAQDDLDAYLDGAGVKSVKAAVEGDASLGGEVDFARVRQADADQVLEFAGVGYLGVDFIVDVTA